MEWKIGEIRQIDNEWYQCVEGTNNCKGCSLFDTICNNNDKDKVFGECSSAERSDDKSVIFKKLEKVGEPITERGRTFQCLNAFKTECTGCVFLNSERGCDKDYYIDSPCPDKEIWAEIKENMKEKKPNMKPFDLEAAKAGKPVCTKDGRKVRIICFDKKGDYPIVALVNNYNDEEFIKNYDKFGKRYIGGETIDDLMMISEKKEGWVNVYKGGLLDTKAYDTRKEAFNRASLRDYVTTVKIEWEE